MIRQSLLVVLFIIVTTGLGSIWFWKKPHSECDIAKAWYEAYVKLPDQSVTFDHFLRDRYRSGGQISNGVFSRRLYSVAIFYSEEDRAKAYDFYVTATGNLSTRGSLSISDEEWNSHRKIDCMI